jgi:hypothetical protein
VYPHRIRLRGPWEGEPLARHGGGALPSPFRMTMPGRWAAAGLADFGGRVRFRRHFGYPGRIDAHERVWLTCAGADDRLEVWLNGTPLGAHPGSAPLEWEVTALLRPRNELVVEVEGPAGRGGLWGEVALEVRCTAYLRGVRVWEEGGRLHAAGEVVGSAEGVLELYLVAGRGTAAYATVTPTRQGEPFHLCSEPGAGSAQERQGKVDLVSGAVVWYTVGWELA